MSNQNVRTGGCLCGAVTFEITSEVAETGACHCAMCRKWSGGIYLGVRVGAQDVTFDGAGNISIFASSPWAERAFCKTCGSSLYYRVTAPGPHHGEYHIGFGTLDDPSGMSLTEEIFIDRKPGAYAFSGKRPVMTEAEVMAMFAPG